MICPAQASRKLTVSVATEHDREAIYRLRHRVYARELRQQQVPNEQR